MKKGEPLSPFDEQKLHLHKRPKWAVKNACMGYAHGTSHGASFPAWCLVDQAETELDLVGPNSTIYNT